MTRVQDEYDTAGESKGVDTSKFHLKYEHLDLLKRYKYYNASTS